MLVHRAGSAAEARRLWAERGPAAHDLFVSNLDEVRLYGAVVWSRRFGRLMHKFVGTTNDLGRRMAEHSDDMDGAVVPLFATPADARHHDVERRVRAMVRSSVELLPTLVPGRLEWSYAAEATEAAYALLLAELDEAPELMGGWIPDAGGLLRPGLWAP